MIRLSVLANIQYWGAVSGILSSVLFFLSLVCAHQVPPVKPWFTAEQTADFWREHEHGAKGGVVIMLIAGAFYLPFSATLAVQVARIPKIHAMIPALLLAAGAAGVFTYIIPALWLSVIPYRLDRNPEITQMLTDAFFFNMMMPWPSFIVQNWAFAYAVLLDRRPRPLFPRFMAYVNIIAPMLYLPGNAMHVAKTGPLAWNGGINFWVIGLVFCTQLIFDSIGLFYAIQTEGNEELVLRLSLKNSEQTSSRSSTKNDA